MGILMDYVSNFIDNYHPVKNKNLGKVSETKVKDNFYDLALRNFEDAKLLYNSKRYGSCILLCEEALKFYFRARLWCRGIDVENHELTRWNLHEFCDELKLSDRDRRMCSLVVDTSKSLYWGLYYHEPMSCSLEMVMDYTKETLFDVRNIDEGVLDKTEMKIYRTSLFDCEQSRSAGCCI
jgi:HEPN domain-containing protein